VIKDKVSPHHEHYKYTLLEEKVLYRTLKGSKALYVFGTPKMQ